MIKNMKYVLLGLFIIWTSVAGISPAAAELNGDQIVAEMDQLMNSDHMTSAMDITVTRPGKDDRTSRIQVYTSGNDKVLVKYLAPAQDKGRAYLRLGDDSWLYMPEVHKSLRVSGKQSMQGSDLSIDDVMRIKVAEDYAATAVSADSFDGSDCFLLDLTAKRPTVTYNKLKYWIRKADFLPAKFECYTSSGIMLKTMVYGRVREIGGRLRPTRMEVTSELKKGYKTVMEMVNADFDRENPESIFSKTYLENGK